MATYTPPNDISYSTYARADLSTTVAPTIAGANVCESQAIGSSTAGAGITGPLVMRADYSIFDVGTGFFVDPTLTNRSCPTPRA